MIALIIIICIVAILALLLSIKVTLKIIYTENLEVYLKIFFIKTKLYPKAKEKRRYKHSMSKKEAQKIKDSLKKKPKKVKKKKKSAKGDDKIEEKEEKADTLSIISIVISFVKNFIDLFARAVRIKASRLKIIVATEDAAQTALTYTAISQSVNLLFPLLDNLKTVKKLPRGKELSVDLDYLSDESRFDIDIELYIRVGGALGAICKAAIRAFKKAVKNEIKKLERKR